MSSRVGVNSAGLMLAKKLADFIFGCCKVAQCCKPPGAEPGPSTRDGGYKYMVRWLRAISVQRSRTAMRLLILAVLLGVVALVLGHRGPDHSNVADSPHSQAFISRPESANFARRHRRNVHNVIYGAAVRSPLEAQREVCELNPDCDELADHIGFPEAYRRFYGPV
ncbi:osteocalcin isoform X2 [Ranitomeya imitator]|uniref:osteocalcin isoform X2 n=1 Tax=Ranitomeya imitator TaxID=111125 RepID=UPI0037E8F948